METNEERKRQEISEVIKVKEGLKLDKLTSSHIFLLISLAAVFLFCYYFITNLHAANARPAPFDSLFYQKIEIIDKKLTDLLIQSSAFKKDSQK